MVRRAPRFRRLQATHRLLLVFVGTILAPGLLLSFFGLRAVVQEMRAGDREIWERLAAAAEDAARLVEAELSEWQQAVEQLDTRAPNAALWPARLRTATLEPGGAVVLLEERGRVQAFPRGQLPYALSNSPAKLSPQPPSTPLWAQAEAAEFRGNNLEEAIALYRQLLDSAKPAGRATVRHRLARCLRKAGRLQEAVAAFRLLEKDPPVLISAIPSDLLGLCEVCLLEHQLGNLPGSAGAAATLYQSLVTGRWQLEKPSYAFYSKTAREKLMPGEEVARLEETEGKKLALAQTAEDFLNVPRAVLASRGATWFAFWRSERLAAVVLSESLVRTHLTSAVALSRAAKGDLQLSLLNPGVQPPSEPPPTRRPLVSWTIRNDRLPFRLQVWPKHPEALYATVERRRNLYLGMLATVMALLGFGGYLTVRTVRTELAVAQIKADFVSTVSHEFRSPLAAIHQLGEMLRDGRLKDDQRRQEYYEMIVVEAQRLRRLVESVLDFARMEDGRKEYQFAPFDPAPWLEQLTQEFQVEAAKQGFAVVADIPADLPTLNGDREALATAIHNLLDNAVKYSGDSKTVWLRVASDGHGVSISVRDKGAGIREDDKPHIFEKFYRGGGEQARQVKGAGLGLSLVKHIVTAHGGDVVFESRAGEGSTFTIRVWTRS